MSITIDFQNVLLFSYHKILTQISNYNANSLQMTSRIWKTSSFTGLGPFYGVSHRPWLQSLTFRVTRLFFKV